MKPLLTVLVLTASVGLVAGCHGREENGEVLGQERFADLYVALLESRKSIPGADTSAANANTTERILKEFGVTVHQLQKSADAYHADPTRWRAFYEMVIGRLDKKNREGNPAAI